MYTYTISAETVDELHCKITAHAATIAVKSRGLSLVSEPESEVNRESKAEKATPKAEKATPKDPPKARAKEVSDVDLKIRVTSITKALAAEGKTLPETLEIVSAILERYGVKRVTLLPPEKREAFMAETEKYGE